jgi:hypothetical protein
MLQEVTVSVLQVQVIQQPLQNPTYLQQLYNTQGQLLMPSNLQLHPAGMNPSSIHVSVFLSSVLNIHCKCYNMKLILLLTKNFSMVMSYLRVEE